MTLSEGALLRLKIRTGIDFYLTVDFPDRGQRVYETNRQNSTYHKLSSFSHSYFVALEQALKTKPRYHNVDSFAHTYQQHPFEMIPSTKTIYRYIAEGLLAVKPIYLPKMVSLRKQSTPKPKTNQKTLGKSIEEPLGLAQTA